MIDFYFARLFNGETHADHYEAVADMVLEVIRRKLRDVVRGQLGRAYSHLMNEIHEVAYEDA